MLVQTRDVCNGFLSRSSHHRQRHRGRTLANRLVQHGLNVTILERGGYLPQEPENWDVAAVFFHQKYLPQETWLDKEGKAFRPGNYYYVGGSSKMYGGTMLRFRERDFESLEHAGGVSPAWPITYRQLAPYYDLAEQLYFVHGKAGIDPTEPPDVPAYPFPALDHEPVIERVASALNDQGIRPFPLPSQCSATKEARACVVKPAMAFPARCMRRPTPKLQQLCPPWRRSAYPENECEGNASGSYQ